MSPLTFPNTSRSSTRSGRELGRLIAERAPRTLNVRSVIGHGNPAKEIVRFADEEKMDLIVMSTQGHSGWHNFLIGSVAEKVVRMATCPVFAVKKALNKDFSRDFL